MSDLAQYQTWRLELGDALRELLYVARRSGDDEIGEATRALLARLAEDSFRLAVVGQFSRGKSTLMNALLGGEYLPVGALPMTSVITTVHYGSRTRATVRRRGHSMPIDVPLFDLRRYVARSSSDRAELAVAAVDIMLPAELLRLGVTFVDTPGVGSAVGTNTATTRHYLPNADALVFVSGFDSVLTEAELDFLRLASQHVPQLFLVVNKRDLVDATTASEVLDFTARRVRETLGEQAPTHLYGLSALTALDARLSPGDPNRTDTSGLDRLESDLVSFLTTEKSRVFLHNLTAAANRLVRRERRDLALGDLDRDDGHSLAVVESAFTARTDTLRAEQHRLLEGIDIWVDTDLRRTLETRRESWQDDLRQLARPHVEAALAEVDAATSPAHESATQARDQINQAMRVSTNAWLDRRTASTREVVVDACATDLGRVLATAREPGLVGAELAGLALPDDRRAAEAAGWSPDGDLPDLMAMCPPWAIANDAGRAIRLRRGRSATHRWLGAVVDAASADFAAALMDALVVGSHQWVARIRDQAEQATNAAIERFAHNLHTDPDADDVAVLTALAARLSEFDAELVRWHPSDEPAASISQPERAGEEATCVVCSQLADAQFGFLRAEQLRLATRDSEQVRHAGAGGFCPLHTWQYAAIASPLGVSAGYAKLASSIADRLRTAVDAREQHDVADTLAALLELGRDCPVCATVANTERASVDNIAADPADTENATTLCLRHLWLVAASCSSRQSSAARTRAFATSLARRSQDMRTYALKREGLQRSLVSNEESHAYLDTLRLLAGLPELAQPWYQQE